MARPLVSISDETSTLATVILGIGASPGPPRGINAKSREAIKNGTYPNERQIRADLAGFQRLLKKAKVTVLRPKNLPGVNQVFARDLGFVIGTTFVRANMTIPARQLEYRGIEDIVRAVATTVVTPPRGVTIEGGDIVLHGDQICVGVGRRTNHAAVPFLRDLFPKRTVVPLELFYRSPDPRISVLHLDCIFQPVSNDIALLFPSGFAKSPGPLLDVFPKTHRIRLQAEGLRDLCCNIFSLSPRRVVSCDNFLALNTALRERGVRVSTIPYNHVSILGGLLRCSTLPLLRHSHRNNRT